MLYLPFTFLRFLGVPFTLNLKGSVEIDRHVWLDNHLCGIQDTGIESKVYITPTLHRPRPFSLVQ